MGKGQMSFTLDQLLAIIQQQQIQTVPSTNTINLPDSPIFGSTPADVPIFAINEINKSSKPSNRCCFSECKKKLLLSDTQCKCNERFCMTHRMPETHNCSFDYKAAGQAQLTIAMPQVIGSKFERI
jgi:hypothetical protein